MHRHRFTTHDLRSIEDDLRMHRVIKRLRAEYSYEAIGARHGCSRQSIYCINRGLAYPHIAAHLDLDIYE